MEVNMKEHVKKPRNKTSDRRDENRADPSLQKYNPFSHGTQHDEAP